MRNESETRAELIDPALRAAGWGEVSDSRVTRETTITRGRLQGAGTRGAQEKADYVLEYKNRKLAVIEAKREDMSVSAGLAQAKHYAQKLQTPFAFATNGHGIYRVDMRVGEESEVRAYPSPTDLWQEAFGESEAREQAWRERFANIPLHDKGGQWQPRYYQHNAITRVVDAIAGQQKRILLTMATGTGKTMIAFQIAWKLFQSGWNLNEMHSDVQPRQVSRRPRILFLADRNILADQAFNAFSAFPEDALVRIVPQEIRSRGRVPTNASVFFTIFQTFMSGVDAGGEAVPSFGNYPRDFFDLVIIDECHRGGANDESTWRGILEYFAPAVQLGLTATPRCDDNVDTYQYFGAPIYEYSLKQGINDGFLTPFRVKQHSTTIDEYVYTSDDDVISGKVERGRRYIERDFNRRAIEIKAREKKRVEIFMRHIDQSQKTLVFCATQNHAAMVRDFINQIAASTNANYCHRVTSADGALGEQHLRTFQDNEKTIPTILTTSRKLSTGVDARNVRNIVLMRRINSIVEFKQIIGRGTRLFDNKDYFTIHDFVKAYQHFSDPEWDGQPQPCPECGCFPCECAPPDPCKKCGEIICTCVKPQPVPRLCRQCGCEPCECEMLRIELGDGTERAIKHMTATSFWHADGRPMSATEFLRELFGELPVLFSNEDELRTLWSKPSTRQELLARLAEKGYGRENLATMQQQIAGAENSDIYDVLAYIAFKLPVLSREQRVTKSHARIMHECLCTQKEFLNFVLEQYVAQGVDELSEDKLQYHIDLIYPTIDKAIDALGEPVGIRELFIDFQQHLYAPLPT